MKPSARSLGNINLKLLQTFILVGEHGSFRIAAEKSFKSQSAISSQIRQLELQLGVDLFHRTTRSVRLTDEGTELLQCARRALLEVESGLRRIHELADIRRGRVSLSCSPTIAETRLATVLAEFEREYPGVDVFVKEVTSEALFDSIRKREVDFGVGPVVGHSEFRFEPILTDAFYAIVPKRFITTGRKTIDLATLTNMPLLVLNRATALRAMLEETMNEQHLSYTTRYQFAQAQTLISMANAGLGAAILPEIALPPRPDPSTWVLRIVNPPLSRQIAVITMRGQNLSPASTRLVQLLKQLIGGPVSSQPALAHD
ncbi:DNA-binding transcriptional LysR family regulator [Paraburkholderia caballeronis]|uniref:LysR family transcriptional regulator n=1 Tax=Paraburkholderia caballeronis TaxID=416943 RepID=UPI0010649310|nr:LysR family transcriptional regulator [Paraburkholderia caballeronis]TDV35611.1 DNA-binding transcriptional LysR family regulator [Paraburkholderia caballeronis]